MLFSCKTHALLWKSVQLLVLRKVSKDFAYKGFQGEKARLCILVKLHSLSPAKGRKLTCLITKPMALTSQLPLYPVPGKLHLLSKGIISNPSWSKELCHSQKKQSRGGWSYQGTAGWYHTFLGFSFPPACRSQVNATWVVCCGPAVTDSCVHGRLPHCWVCPWRLVLKHPWTGCHFCT